MRDQVRLQEVLSALFLPGSQMRLSLVFHDLEQRFRRPVLGPKILRMHGSAPACDMSESPARGNSKPFIDKALAMP